jgi:hypothetical protein
MNEIPLISATLTAIADPARIAAVARDFYRTIRSCHQLPKFQRTRSIILEQNQTVAAIERETETRVN